MAVLKKKYKIWETEYYFIEAVVENIWWEKIINKSFEKKLNLIVEQIIKDNKFLALKKKFSISILFTGDKKINQLRKYFEGISRDENFDETIKSRFRDDFTYASFSEGEKMRIDLALLFTWRHIAKMKNSTNTNLLILDEIFDGSLDGQGTDDFFKIITQLTKENIFIISHKGDIMFDKFTNIIKYEKYKNFTRLQPA